MSTFDNLCDKLKPYVGSALHERPEPSEEDKRSMEDILRQFSFFFDIPQDPKELYKIDADYIDLCTDIMAATWSDTLRFAYKEQGEIKLRDCLLPDNLGSAERAWDLDTSRLGLSPEQLEDMMQRFGQEEISDKLDLPWGGYVKRVGEGYELCKSGEVK